MSTVRTGPVLGLIAQLVLLAGLAGTVGLGAAGWLAGARVRRGPVRRCSPAACGRPGADALGPADRVTLTRAILVGGVTPWPWTPSARPAPVGGAGRRSPPWRWCSTRSTARWPGAPAPPATLGARFDMEVDAFLILVLSVHVAPAGRRLGARHRRDAVRLRRRELGAALDAGHAAAALLAQGRRGRAGRRAGRRDRRRAAPAAGDRRWWRARWRCWSSRSATTSPGCGGTAGRRPAPRVTAPRAAVPQVSGPRPPRARPLARHQSADGTARAVAGRAACGSPERATPVAVAADAGRRPADGPAPVAADRRSGTARPAERCHSSRASPTGGGTGGRRPPHGADAPEPSRPRVTTVLAGLLVLAALVAPDQLGRLTPGAFLRIPVEGLRRRRRCCSSCRPGPVGWWRWSPAWRSAC